MTNDLKERLREMSHMFEMALLLDSQKVCLDTIAYITDLEEARDSWMRACNLALQEKLVVEARLAAAEAGEVALAEALRELATDPRDDSICVGDGWDFYTDTVEFARTALAAYEARRKG